MGRRRFPTVGVDDFDEPLTNIGTSVPPRVPLTEPVRPGQTLPVAQFEGETPGARMIAPDPDWISRWQPSATRPLDKAPWIVGYRWWVAGVMYESWGPDELFRIDLMWRDHKHAYSAIPRTLWEDFRKLGSSVGQWFHKNILGPGWKPGKGSLFPDWPLP